MKKSLLFLTICIFLLACKSEPERILIKLNKGQKYKQRLVSKTTNTQNAQGKNRSTTAISESVYNYEVVDVQDSIYTFKVEYESMTTSLQKEGGEAIQNQGPVAEMLEKIKGQAYQMKMSNTGRVVEIVGADSIFLKLANSAPGLTEEMRSSLSATFIKTYGDSAIRNNSFQYANVYPSKAVVEGDTWSVKKEGGKDLFSPEVDATYRVDKITGSKYIIAMKSKLSVNTDEKSSPLFSLSMYGTMDSMSEIDKKTGLVTETKMKQDMVGNMKILKGPASMAGTSIMMQVKGEITITNTLM